MKLGKFLELTRVSFRESFAYRLDAFTSLISSGLFLVMYFFVWEAIAAAGTLNTSVNQVMTYLVIGQVVNNTTFINAEVFFGDKIRKGTIVNELKRPVSIFSQAYFNELGRSGYNFVSKALPVGITGMMLINIPLPSPANTVLFVLSLFLSFNLVFLFSYAASMLIFWTKVDWAIKSARTHIQKLFAGVVFPLYLLPESIKPVFDILPFQAMVDGPIRIFTMAAGKDQALQIIGNQALWIIILFIVAHFSWKKARKKLTVQGG